MALRHRVSWSEILIEIEMWRGGETETERKGRGRKQMEEKGKKEEEREERRERNGRKEGAENQTEKRWP